MRATHATARTVAVVLFIASCGSQRALTQDQIDEALIYQVVLESASYPEAQVALEHGHAFCLQLFDTSSFDGIEVTYMDTSLRDDWQLFDELTRANATRIKVQLPANSWPCAQDATNVIGVRFSRVAVGQGGLKSAVLVLVQALQGDVAAYSKDVFVLKRDESSHAWHVARRINLARW
jgi:hypothetical protein